MRLRTYRDESRACHLDHVGGSANPWTIDLVSLVATLILVTSFVCAVVAQLV